MSTTCTETVKKDSVGVVFVINADFDLSGYSELKMVFKKPDGTLITKLTSDGVTAPATDLTITKDGVDKVYLANMYWRYASEVGLLDTKSTWGLHGEYVDGTPKDLPGDKIKFKVVERT